MQQLDSSSSADPTGRTVTLAYSAREDRITLEIEDTQGGRNRFWLTRRFTNRLINGLAGILERSSPTATRVPREMRDDVILMEHQSALAASRNRGLPPKGKSPSPARPQFVQHRLLSKVNVRVASRRFELTFCVNNEPVTSLSIGRSQLHQVLEGLSRQAADAGWNIKAEVVWMEPGQTELVLN